MPFHLFKGSKILYYKGKIFYNIEELPEEFDSKKDLYFSCDCEFPKWRNVERIC